MGAQYNRNASAILENNVAANVANNAYAANAKGYTEYPLSPGGSSLFFSGYYLSGMLFLTGKSKAAAYQVDNNTNGGSFRRIQIKHPLSAGGWAPRAHGPLQRGRSEQWPLPRLDLLQFVRLGANDRRKNRDL